MESEYARSYTLSVAILIMSNGITQSTFQGSLDRNDPKSNSTLYDVTNLPRRISLTSSTATERSFFQTANDHTYGYQDP